MFSCARSKQGTILAAFSRFHVKALDPNLIAAAADADRPIAPSFWHDGCFGRRMSVHLFTSESYCEVGRADAWQDVLGGFGLQSQPISIVHGGHATALSRAALDVVGLLRFAGGPQFFCPV